MTPIRETIARTVYDAMAGDLPSRDLDEVADAVLRALDEAGPVVVPKEASTAMILATLGKVEINWHCAGRRSDYDLCETAFEPACLPDIYRAMIAAAPDGGPA